MSDRQTPPSQIDLHASIVESDGTVRPVDVRPMQYWKNAAGAARGAQCRDDQLAGVENSQQPARGEPRCGGLSGASQAGDTHCLGNGRISKLRARLRYTRYGSYWEVERGAPDIGKEFLPSLSYVFWAADVAALLRNKQGGKTQYTGPAQVFTNGGW